MEKRREGSDIISHVLKGASYYVVVVSQRVSALWSSNQCCWSTWVKGRQLYEYECFSGELTAQGLSTLLPLPWPTTRKNKEKRRDLPGPNVVSQVDHSISVFEHLGPSRTFPQGHCSGNIEQSVFLHCQLHAEQRGKDVSTQGRHNVHKHLEFSGRNGSLVTYHPVSGRCDTVGGSH
jgi:hypothetical protein